MGKKTYRNGLKKKVILMDNIGMKNGLKILNNYLKRKTRMEIYLIKMNLKVMKSRNKIATNGAKMKILNKSGMKNGEKFIKLTQNKNGVTNGKSI